MSEQMAVIRDAHLEAEDHAGTLHLVFSTYITECSAATQWIGWDDARKILEQAGARQVSDLNGKTCWVDADGHLIRFLRMYGDAAHCLGSTRGDA